MHPNNSEKNFFKTLGNALFDKENRKYTIDNIVFIDNNLEKSNLNYIGNAIFLESWTMDENDSYLNLELEPWLQALSTT